MVAGVNNQFDDHKLGALKSAHELLHHLSGYLADVEAVAEVMGEDNLHDEMCFSYASAIVLKNEVAGLREKISQALKPRYMD